MRLGDWQCGVNHRTSGRGGQITFKQKIRNVPSRQSSFGHQFEFANMYEKLNNNITDDWHVA